MMIVINTNDGSSTIELPELGWTYHSKHGAINESQHVFIEAGLLYYLDRNPEPEVHIFEMGFGTGLNCLLSFKVTQELPIKVYYTGIEMHPLHDSVYNSLNYCLNEQLYVLKDVFQQMHSSEWEKPVKLSSSFQLTKINADIRNFIPHKSYDVIYFDAFAPGDTPDQWTEDIFKRFYTVLNPQSVFVTYSSKVIVRRALESAGFSVHKIPGPAGKREIVRAIKQ
ncbi:MAG TPA: tRNA (5-methylaminomethyl-2-thiouridine)(34)-methyltransferase MnmD [Flavitalea sp.]|nr:tRNA (5-methylaminomethyl-2-thiouridine)(34)-methyltransferase MnmD [Flavitalea sp.]